MNRRKVIFVPDDYWTNPPPKENPMNTPAAVNRPLTDAERHLINEILEWKIGHNIAQQGVHVDPDSVTADLDDLNERTPLQRQYGEHHVHIHTGDPDQVILRVTREFLAYYSVELTHDQMVAALNKGEIA